MDHIYMQALVIQPLVTIGSHLLEGNIVYTNVEIIMGESKKLQFTSEKDGPTPWNELQIKHIE